VPQLSDPLPWPSHAEACPQAIAQLTLSPLQVAALEFHPELPLLATFDRGNYLTVWDYARGEPVFECQLGADSLYNKDTLDAAARAEANPDFFGAKMFPYMAANYLQPAAYGRPRSLAFLDLETVAWTIGAQRALTMGAAATLPSVAHVRVLAEQRRLVVACERAVVLLDIVSKRVRSRSYVYTPVFLTISWFSQPVSAATLPPIAHVPVLAKQRRPGVACGCAVVLLGIVCQWVRPCSHCYMQVCHLSLVRPGMLAARAC
jgi:hypothetical protein